MSGETFEKKTFRIGNFRLLISFEIFKFFTRTQLVLRAHGHINNTKH
jgi:hypothetical protein